MQFSSLACVSLLGMSASIVSGVTASSSSSKPMIPPPARRLQEKLMAKKKIPSTGEPWQSTTNGMEFQPASDLSPLAQEHLRRLTTGSSETVAFQQGFQAQFIDGAETYYDDYAQAWRAMGFFIDCNGQTTMDENQDNQEEDYQVEEQCIRYMLWAAYIDEDYSGNGAGEYSYYNRHWRTWDRSACNAAGSSRCAKLDCHNSNTHFSLLGFFKEPNYGEWMEQLFKYEGDCVWSDSEYSLMQGNREVWPEACTAGAYNLFYDLKPSQFGEFELGLYTDERCSVEYSGELSTLEVVKETYCNMTQQINENEENNEVQEDNENQESIVQANPCDSEELNYFDALADVGLNAKYNNGGEEERDHQGDIWELASSMNQWNDAFDVFKQCQPCKTHDISSVKKNVYGDRYNWTSAALYQDENNEDNGDGENSSFQCNDNYESVNQCMRFQANTEMTTASWSDLEMAYTQGTISNLPVNLDSSSLGEVMWSNVGSSLYARDASILRVVLAWGFLLLSAILFGRALFRYRAAKADADQITEPLMAGEGGGVVA